MSQNSQTLYPDIVETRLIEYTRKILVFNDESIAKVAAKELNGKVVHLLIFECFSVVIDFRESSEIQDDITQFETKHSIKTEALAWTTCEVRESVVLGEVIKKEMVNESEKSHILLGLEGKLFSQTVPEFLESF